MKNEDVSTIINVAERAYKALFEISKINSQEIKVRCPDNFGEYSVGFEIKKGIRRKIKRKISFDTPGIRRVNIHSTPFMKSESDAIVTNGNGFDIILDKLSKDTDTFWVTIEYDINNHDFLDNLVQRDRQTESISDTKNEYWMHAQLKNLEPLRTNYGKLDLQDIDFFVDVGVFQDVKTAIPKPFTQDLEIIAKWISSKDRGEKWKYSMEHMRKQKSKRYAGREQEVLVDLQNLFLPTHFNTFVDVFDSFHYSDCIRGKDYFDNIPFPTFPKVMKVISRTDLSLEKPASQGKLIYNKQNFRDEIEKIFLK